MNQLARKPSGKALLRYQIVADPTTGVLNQLTNCYGHPDDGPANLILRDPQEESDVPVQITRVTALEQVPAETGPHHFSGELEGGGTITGHIRPGPAVDGYVGSATLAL